MNCEMFWLIITIMAIKENPNRAVMRQVIATGAVAKEVHLDIKCF